ncbi:MAG: DNA-3-methyladenine glycosylase I [Elusimicrobiaceae bacterium]|mgnify:CR=1 FL=1|jgi:DNA-3-methyladenine glycosylase I|nr:DNA-3-methyladenine glycosylase I [Elusimicrobiaceae bacterium]MBT3954990.1 DNA-3-methyladenine glycosylase I [Elusimicrobiaceae bacterium]MBT4008118.1 DNA-3-methyladenine glycosylase I [Elusimicrobiaceae bacterium]MBT4402686.1 DNA-3-methyladenine glycosylase I [Elusimicrobiaceae bacterium]MBT4440030.1 DNA-3-methyladenine glycosylase I [Elusimicrobiaceae bacterium]
MIKKRCQWCGEDIIYVKYHDEEWGVPVHDDRQLFEKLSLDGAQAGLSWITILKRVDNYKKAFDNFDVKKIVKYDDKKIEELLQDAGIIRNRLKVKSVVSNAKVFMEIQKEFDSFDKYLWGFVNYKTIVNDIKTMKDIPVKSEISDKLSADLKNRGMKFVGSVIIYAYMQAIGMVNDHVNYCFRK